jgi:hypothetical protein
MLPALLAGLGSLGGEAGLGALLGQTLAFGVASPALATMTNRMIEGSPEEQMRRQMKLQSEFEQQQAADQSELEGLISRRSAPTMSELMGENALMKQVEEAAYKLKKARAARPRHLDELGDIIAGQHARIAALQSERTLSPVEIIQMMEGIGG